QQWMVRLESPPFAALVTGGNLVDFEAAPEADDAARLVLLGSCTGALLYQRGLIPLHANAVVTPRGGAVLIAGRIGAGKSTTTLSLLRMGHRLLADDISA